MPHSNIHRGASQPAAASAGRVSRSMLLPLPSVHDNFDRESASFSSGARSPARQVAPERNPKGRPLRGAAEPYIGHVERHTAGRGQPPRARVCVYNDRASSGCSHRADRLTSRADASCSPEVPVCCGGRENFVGDRCFCLWCEGCEGCRVNGSV